MADCIVLQTYGNEPLSAMVAWLRHTARQLGHQSPLEAPLLATMETHTYQEVQQSIYPVFCSCSAVTCCALRKWCQDVRSSCWPPSH